MPNIMLLHKNALNITHQARVPPSGGVCDDDDSFKWFISNSHMIFALPFLRFIELATFASLWFDWLVTAATMWPFGALFCCDINCSSAIFQFASRWLYTGHFKLNSMSWPQYMVLDVGIGIGVDVSVPNWYNQFYLLHQIWIKFVLKHPNEFNV